MEALGKCELQMIEDSHTANVVAHEKSISTKLTPPVSGDVLESWSFLWRFREVLGLRKCFSLEETITELSGPFFDGLSEAHILILQVLIGEFLGKLKPGRERIVKCSTESMKNELKMPPLNGLTWPELARRYFLAMFMTEDPNSEDVFESVDIIRCLYGDGGPKCGALTGVVGLEVDALVLAASVHKIYGSLYVNSDKLAMNNPDSDEKNTGQSAVSNEGIPPWIQELEPVPNLKTNNGAKIRNCIISSLKKNPPEYAEGILKHSISKEVYVGNASGRTKQCALQVVAEFHSRHPNLTRTRNTKNFISISDIVMKNCRILLRRAASSEKTKRFCSWLGKNLMSCGNNKECIVGSSAMVSSLFNLRMIDRRLAVGAYCGSHEAFIEDVREFWRYVQIDYVNFPPLVKLAMEASLVFESLCVKEVVALHQKLKRYSQVESLSGPSLKDIEDIVIFSNEIPKAPWEEGVCRVCGIDWDDEKVLLCDECDTEYHTYCLSPPLVTIPQGNWFCPRCVANKVVNNAPINAIPMVYQRPERKKGEFIDLIIKNIADLEAMVQGKDYWELNLHQRARLLKFFCNEMLDSTLLLEHLSKCKSCQPQNPKEKENSSLRTKFLGIDFDCILYWKFDIGTNPWIAANHINDLAEIGPTFDELTEKCAPSGVEHLLSPSGSEVYSSWTFYRSHAEMKSIVDSLKDDDPMEKDLKESILLNFKLGVDAPKDSKGQGQMELQPSSLEQGLKPMGLDSLKTKATKVLELKFGPFVKAEKIVFLKKWNKGKEAEGSLCRCACLEPVLPTGHHCPSCHKTCFNNRDLKLHRNEICIFKSRETIDITLAGEGATNSMAPEGKKKITCSQDGIAQPNSLTDSVSEVKPEDLEIGNNFSVPVSSLMPLMGKASEILTQLKINLLDMEAAIPNGALRPSRLSFDRRCAWRFSVKHANTIYEMVQALIVFQDMIKPEYLDCSWRYWSSLSAAANISTLAALSLRIYSLDAAISYEKISCASSSTGLLGKTDSVKEQCNLGPKGKPGKKRKREMKKQLNLEC